MPGLWDIPRFSLLPGRSRPHPDPSEGRDREGVGRAAASIFMRLQRIQAFKYSSGERSLSLPAGTGEKREERRKNGKRGRKTGRGDEQPPVSGGRGAASSWGCDIRALSPAEGRAGCRDRDVGITHPGARPKAGSPAHIWLPPTSGGGDGAFL